MSSGSLPTYRPVQEYVQNRLREPPRLAVPPPYLEYARGHPKFVLETLSPYRYDSAEYGNPAFLQAIVARSKTRFDHEGLNWRYEQRRTAQKILPYLFLGPSTIAKSLDFIQSQGITLLVAVRSGAAARACSKLLDPSTFASSTGIQTLTLDLESPYDFMTKLPGIIKAINNHIEHSCSSNPPADLDDMPSKVLLFCESGNERSATLAAAYVMLLYSLDAVEAMQMVQAQRFCAAIDDAMKNMLVGFQDILVAKRDVAVANNGALHASQHSGSHPTSGVTEPTKRSMDDIYDLEMTMDAGDNRDAVGGYAHGRNGQAPFQDA